VQHRLRGGDNDDHIRPHERGVNPERNSIRRADLDEVFALDVVHLHVAVKAAGELRRHERLELFVAGPARHPSGHEQRLVSGRNSEAFEFGHGCRDRRLPRVPLGSRHREVRRLDDDRDAPAARDKRLERLAREREAQRVANGGTDVRDRVGGRRRSQHERIVSCGDDHELRPREQRDPRHGRWR
jgi:hypothetical protein